MSAPDPTADELVSAYLDGEATADERARVEADPALLARVEELRVVSRVVATPPAPTAAARDAAVARAIEAARRGAADDESGPVAPVVDLARRRRTRLGVALGAAAAVVVAVVAVPALFRDETPRFDEVAASIPATDPAAPSETDAPQDGADRSADDQGAAGGEEAADAGDDAGGPGGPSTTGPRATTPATDPATAWRRADLGTFATRDDARAAVTAAIDQALLRAGGDGSPAEHRSDGESPCEQGVRAGDRELADLVYAADFRIGDVAHQVLVFRLHDTGATNGTHRIYEHRVAGCELVSVQTVTPRR